MNFKPTRETEILIADHPGGVHSDHLSMPTETQLRLHEQQRDRIAHAPVIDWVYSHTENSAIAGAILDPRTDPFLLCHLDEGVPLFPAVMGMELCAEAAEILTTGLRPVEVRDFKLLGGLRMGVSTPHRAQVHIEIDGELASGKLSGDFYDKQGRLTDPERQYQSCTMRLSDTIADLAIPDLGPPPTEWEQVPYPDDWRTRTGNKSGTVFYGPALRTLKAVHYAGEIAWGMLVAPPLADLSGSRTGDRWMTPPALLDGVLLGCDLFATHLFNSRQFPHAVERLEFGRMPREGEQCLSRTLYLGREDRHFIFEFWLLGDDGAVLFHCQGCRFVEVGRPA